MLRSLIRILRVSLVQIDTEVAEKYANQWYALSSHSDDMTQDVCQQWARCPETGVRVESKVGNLHSEFGHAKPSGSRVIRYVRDERTDAYRRSDKSNTLRAGP